MWLVFASDFLVSSADPDDVIAIDTFLHGVTFDTYDDSLLEPTRPLFKNLLKNF